MDFYAIISQFSVRFIRNQIDHRTKLLLFFLEDRSKFFDRLLRINNTGRVMWRIYDHCTGIGCNLLFQFFQNGSIISIEKM